jgi:hypothetical protein
MEIIKYKKAPELSGALYFMESINNPRLRKGFGHRLHLPTSMIS